MSRAYIRSRTEFWQRLFQLMIIATVGLYGIAVSQKPSKAATDATLFFTSDTSWQVYSSDPAQGTSVAIGTAQLVCLNPYSPQVCPSNAMSYDYPGSGWFADLGSTPGASWIWAPGINPLTTPADLQQYYFSKTIVLAEQPIQGALLIASDDFAEVRVNGQIIGSIGSVTDYGSANQAQATLATFDITPFLVSGNNVVTIRAQNGPADFAGTCGVTCNYMQNPAGVVLGGFISYSTCENSELSVEAENGNLGNGFVIASDSSASGGQYIHVPSGTGDAYSQPLIQQRVTYCFNLSTSGKYRIKGKVYGADSLSDSFYVKVDNAPSKGYLWDIKPNTSYDLDYVNDRDIADPVEVNLDAGRHTVSVYLREDGTRLDTLELELVSNSGLPPVCAGLLQEAENGSMNGDFVIGSDSAASGGQYIQTPEGSGTYWNGANSQQKSSYCFDVPSDGIYRIRAKAYGADTLSDSFYVQVDGAPTLGYLWDVVPNNTYALDYVNDRGLADPVEVQLTSGQHIVTVFAREDGARLDTVELQFVEPVSTTLTCTGLSQEAEDGNLHGNFIIEHDSAASGGAYVYTPEGSGDFWYGADKQQKVTYCFNVELAGVYRIDAQVYGVDNLSDSFYVKVDDDPNTTYLWDVLQNTSYLTDSLSTRNGDDPVMVPLAAGQHTVTVYAREDGTRLDALQLVFLNTPTAQSRSGQLVAQPIHGNVNFKVTGLTEEIDFTQIAVSLRDVDTDGRIVNRHSSLDRFAQFHFDNVVPGNYLLQLELPSGLIAENDKMFITASTDATVNLTFNAMLSSTPKATSKTYLPFINR